MGTTHDLDYFKGADVFDSREFIERINELEATEDDLDEDEAAELVILKAFAEEASGYVADWPYGEGFIRDIYFKEYAEELAEDIGAIDKNASWPLTYIDWDAAADALKQDYTSFELDGVTFWARS